MPTFSNRTGETLVEVVVAFSIMSFVLIGVSGLITQLVSMISESRTVTEATALAQEGLVDGLAVVGSRCDIREEIPGNDPLEADLITTPPRNGITLKVDLMVLDSSEEDAANELDYAHGFRKVVSTVSWNDSLGKPQKYVLTQVIKR
jgi:hypothetical protein